MRHALLRAGLQSGGLAVAYLTALHPAKQGGQRVIDLLGSGHDLFDPVNQLGLDLLAFRYTALAWSAGMLFRRKGLG